MRALTFDKLSESAQQRAREWYISGAFDHAWYESVYEDAKECFALLGIDVREIYFSGFSSQGDGACFEGAWDAEKVQPGALKEHAPQDATLHRIAETFEEIASCRPQAHFSVTHSGSYYHDLCTGFDVSLGETYFDTLVEPCNAEFLEQHKASMEKLLIQATRDLMKWLYRQLEKENDYIQSDEAVDENIQANEWKFNEDGKFLH